MSDSVRSQVFLIVPACGKDAYHHFEKTIMRAWTLNDILRLGVKLPEDVIKKLRNVGEFRIWGCVPGVSGWERAWEKLDKGGVVAFYRDKSIVCWGKVFAKVRDPLLAEKLWGRDKKGRTWEYVYFIRDLRWVRIPWDRVRAELGYNEGFIPQGHTIVAEDRIKKIIQRYGGVEAFLEALEGSDNVRRSRRFKSTELLLPTIGNALSTITGIEDSHKAVLYTYGRFLIELANMGVLEVSKEVVEGIAERVLGDVITRFAQSKAMLYNDLRRLCVLSIGGGGDWRRGVSARFTLLGRVVVECVERLRGYGVPVDDEFLLFVGGLPIFLCLEGFCMGCRGDEAGACLSLARGGGASRELVEYARRVVCRHVDWLLACGVPRVRLGMCRGG